MTNTVKAIAFHLPQFHPIPENDEWWGKGFTEWTNVAKAKPLFEGHYQPHLPADLGFYDLRVPEARAAQAELAKAYGIAGFCYYHYWFQGRRLLGRPVDGILSSGLPDFPFCLCWANENWTRRWLGEDREILIGQSYTTQDDVKHAEWLVQVFGDRRYLRANERPVFLIYRPGDLPEPRRTTEIVSEACVKSSEKNPYLIGVDAHRAGWDFRNDGFDSTLEFQPQLAVLPEAFEERFSLRRLRRNLRTGIFSGRLRVYDDGEARDRMLRQPSAFPTVPCVFVGWDNTARRSQNGVIIVNGSPERYGCALEKAIARVKTGGDTGSLLFINAWNEWAEGNHLEPCQKWGRKYLEATRRALTKFADDPSECQNLVVGSVLQARR